MRDTRTMPAKAKQPVKAVPNKMFKAVIGKNVPVKSAQYEKKAAHANMLNAVKKANAEWWYKNASKATRVNYLKAMNRSSAADKAVRAENKMNKKLMKK